MEYLIGSKKRLCLGERPLRFGGTVGVLVKRQLPAFVGHIGWGHPEPDQSPTDPGSAVTTRMIEPGLELPPDAVGQRCIIKRVRTAPGARPEFSVCGFRFDFDPVGRHPIGRELDEKSVGECPGRKPSLLQVLQRGGESFLDGEFWRERPRMGGTILPSGKLMRGQPFGAES